jgi:type I restriction enzyme S subunit
MWNGAIKDCTHQNHLIRVRPAQHILPKFLELVWNSPRTADYLRSVAGSTSGLYTLSTSKIKVVPVPVPPIEVQQRIIDILEDHLSRVDAGANLLNAAIRRLAALERAALVGAAQPGATTRPLSEVAEIQGGIQKQPKRKPASNAYPFLRVANVTGNGLDLADVHQIELFGNELGRLRLERGDLLVVEGNGSPSQIGRAALWDGSIPNCVHQNHLIRVRPKESLLPEFLEVVWNSPNSREELTRVASSTSGLHTLSVSKISILPIPVPPIDEQRRAVAEVARVRDDRRRLEDQARAVLVRSLRLRRAVLTAAFSGRLTGRTNAIVEERFGD